MTSQGSDFSAYKAFEHKGWERATPQYHDAFGYLTSQGIRAALCDMVRGYQIGEKIELPMPAVLASASKR